jgi:predicted nucleic acid-binding protein
MTLVDTSAWVEYLRQSKSETAERVEHLLLMNEAAWCEAILLELWNGASFPQRRKLEQLETLVPLLSINATVWNQAMRLARAARAAAVTAPSIDILVAACAHVHGVQLEHHEDDHFNRLSALI